MILRLSHELEGRIRAHAVEGYPHECCGALLGRDHEGAREVLQLVPLVNRQDDSPRNRFVITAEDVLRADRVANETGLALVGWYHSHPDAPAIPSEYDRENAWPWYSYVIVRVDGEESRELTAWRLADDRSNFRPEKVELVVQGRPAARPGLSGQ